MTDLQELLKRISDFALSYRFSGYKAPLFRLTPFEHGLLRHHLMSYSDYIPEYYGHLPTYLGADFELVGPPQLFNGKHMQSESGIEE